MIFPSATGRSTTSAAPKNILINGAFAIDQRNSGAAQTITAAAAKAYTVDRWYAYCTGANVTGQQVAGSLQSQFRYRFTGAASNTVIQFGQRIEAANSYHLNGQVCTLSVDLANSLLSTVTWTAYYANTLDAFGTIASPTRTQIATGTFTVTSTIARYSTQISVPLAATTGIEIVFSVANQTSGTWTIGDAQWELGGVPTPIERKNDFNRCLWYAQKNRTLWIWVGGSSTNFNGGAPTPRMFSLPVITIINGVAAIHDISTGFRDLLTIGLSGASYLFGTMTATSLNKMQQIFADRLLFEAEL